LFADDIASGGLAGWSPDGSALLLEGDGLSIVDPSGTVLESITRDELCRYPCAGMESFSISPDGTRIAFVRIWPDDENSTVVAILDLASHEVTELESTRTTNGSADERCWLSTRCQGMDDTPRWSPDGTRLVFARQVMSPEPGSNWTSAAVYVVNADGSELRRVTPEGWYAFDASWSPDGAALAFVNLEQIVDDDRTSVAEHRTDIHTVRADGGQMRQLTHDGSSFRPAWTADGQLTYVRQIGSDDAPRYENWIMGPEGNDRTRLGTTLADLTRAGCVSCLYPVDHASSAFWQPPR
jgi:Tol biopolymer transport system component